ncbi:MAG: carboxypeptidase-like regulatory domain-containing protein [bacterium]
MNARTLWVGTAWLLVAAAGSAHAQDARQRGVIDGIVTDTGVTPLANATIAILGTSIHVMTGASGRFRIVDLPPEQMIVVVQHIGYVPTSVTVQVAPADTERMAFSLSRIATELDTVVVTAKRLVARMQAFELRRAAGFGQFVTRDDIDKSASMGMTEVLRPVMGIRLAMDAATNMVAMSSRSVGRCPYVIFVDGVRQQAPVNLNSLPVPADIAGIEVYPGSASIPLEYKSVNTGCGVILIWARVGS